MEYSDKELDLVENFIREESKICKSYSVEDLLKHIQNKKDRILESELKDKYVGKFIKLEINEDGYEYIWCGLVDSLSVCRDDINFVSNYFLVKSRDIIKFENRSSNYRDTASFKISRPINIIDRSTFEELLITYINYEYDN